MLKLIDNFLNSITMYKLLSAGLSILVVISLVFGLFGILPFTVWQLLSLLFIVVIVCFITNILFAKLFKAVTSVESYLITALILYFLLAPITNLTDFYISIAAAILAMASKYILAIHKKHIFNPAAIAVFILGLLGFGNAIWWVGSTVMLPFVLVLGLLVVRKIRKFSLLGAFLLTAIITIIVFNLGNNLSPQESFIQAFISWPLIFFGTIMLTEPQTTPPTRRLAVVYGALTGVLFGLQFHIGILYASPEFALVVGNIFSYIVSPKRKLFINLKEKNLLAPNIYGFIFNKDPDFKFTAGQYMEWTIDDKKVDSRGNRRYFTIASSPTEENISIGVKIIENSSSSFKKALLNMQIGAPIVASQLAGDFVLPEDKQKKLVFIAGGIGITPFRSMVKYLIDNNEKRDIILFYTCLNPEEFVYKDIFRKGEEVLNLKTVYVLTDNKNVPAKWNGEVGFLTKEMIAKYIPEYKDHIFYISGPNIMVESYKKLLNTMNVSRNNIVTDYFSGY